MKNWHCSKHLPIILLPAAALLIGFFIIKNYGERWDEADIYRYGDYAINAYAFILHPHNLPTFNTILSLFGPAYYAITDLTARFLTLVIPSWSIANAWHFVYFLLFPGNARAVHLLCLFQLLLWGHAFINPKDVPFMAFFAVTIYAGLKMTDHYQDSRKLGMTLVVAAVLLVLTILFRVVGSPAGLIVLVYAPFKLGARTIMLAASYLSIAGITAYLTWPYQWNSFIPHFVERVRTWSQFPFATNILFWGKLFRADRLPRTYCPTLPARQLTEPTLMLVGAGIGISAILLHRRENLDE